MAERVGLSRRARLRIAAAIAVFSAIGIVVLAVLVSSHGNHEAHLPLRLQTRAAGAPFEGYGATRVEVDGRCRPVAVADTGDLRVAGLRDHTDLGQYAGMLFVFEGNTNAAFTMAGVTDALEIGWYSAVGTRVDGAHMAPCPNHGQADCPIYSSDTSYRIAFERPAGSAAPSNLAPCS
jgi:uncharacterized membrane protein (UPF0127 family)